MKQIGLIAALVMTFATQATARCGNLCDYEWWEAGKTTADVQAEKNFGDFSNLTSVAKVYS